MAGRLKNKIIIITGAGQGIGRAAANLFASEGARLALVDINSTFGAEAADVIRNQGGDAIFIKTDLTDSAQVEGMIEKVVNQYGRIDVLYNNAGINHFAKIADTTEAAWERVMAVNVKSVFLTCKYVIPVMVVQGHGTIINTGSSTSLVGLANLAAYTAS